MPGKEQSFVLIGLKKLIFAFIWTNSVAKCNEIKFN
jgi:hypothetical protein